jgi:hypothetical protein
MSEARPVADPRSICISAVDQIGALKELTSATKERVDFFNRLLGVSSQSASISLQTNVDDPECPHIEIPSFEKQAGQLEELVINRLLAREKRTYQVPVQRQNQQDRLRELACLLQEEASYLGALKRPPIKHADLMDALREHARDLLDSEKELE